MLVYCVVLETIAGYDISYRRDGNVEFIFTNAFADNSLVSDKNNLSRYELPEYHGGAAVFLDSTGTVYAHDEIAKLVEGPAYMSIKSEKFGINIEGSYEAKYLFGIGINSKIYKSIPARENKLEFESSEFGIEGKLMVKRVFIRPLPKPNSRSISKIFSYFLNNPRGC